MQVVALPGPRASLREQPGRAQGRRRAAARPPRLGQRNVDRARRPDVELAGRHWSGIGESCVAEPTARNPHNHGRPVLRAVGARRASRARRGPRRLVGRGDAARAHAQPRRRRRQPRRTRRCYGHCYDGCDVMCYHDGGPAAPAERPVPADPGRDEPGLRLRRRRLLQRRPGRRHLPGDHWNIYDNRFLAAARARRPACGGTTVPDPTRSRRSPPREPASAATPASARC